MLATLTHKEISDYIAEKIQAGRLAPRTVNHSLVLLKEMLEAAVDWGYLAHNPARRVRKLKIGRADPHRPLFATRKIDVRAAYNERTDVLGRPKSDTSIRAVVMVPTVHHALVALSKRTASGLVFPGPDGSPLPSWMLYERGFRPAIKRAGVNRIRFHDLRHTYASLLIMAGKHPKYIADQMGHASAAFTLDTYGHLMGRLPVQPVEWIDDLVFPEGLEAALKLHLSGAPNGAVEGHAVPRGEGGEADRDRAGTQDR